MTDIIPYEPTHLELAGPIADAIAQKHVLEEWKATLSQQTLRRHTTDIALFQTYLNEECHIQTGDMLNDIEMWRGLSYGITKGFRTWMLTQGYAMQSVNVRLATVKKYAKIAFESGVIDTSTFGLIQTVNGYYGKAARNVDDKREKTRTGAKKAEATTFSLAHLTQLLTSIRSEDDYIARRDYLLVCLFVFQGLRCSEVASLQTQHISLAEGTFTVERHKVNKRQTHDMHEQTLWAMQRYLQGLQTETPRMLFEGVDRKAWTDTHHVYHKAHHKEDGLSVRAINERIGALGRVVSIENLSPHDLRHWWTTDLFKKKTPLDVVMQAGGWSSYKMPLAYRTDSTVANEGVQQSMTTTKE